MGGVGKRVALVTRKKKIMANRDVKGHKLIRLLPAQKSVGNCDIGTKVRLFWSECVNSTKTQLIWRFN